MGCEHDKCYPLQFQAVWPPEYPWICRKCLEEGVDRPAVPLVLDEYQSLKERKENHDGPPTVSG